jgi:hypothetical protein
MPGRPGGFGRAGMAGGPGTGVQIVQTDSTVTVDYTGGMQLTLHTDGRKIRREAPNGGSFTLESRWQENRLVVERSMRRMKIIQHYWLSEDSARLYVRTLIEGSRMAPIEFRRTYDAPAGQSR